MLDNDGRPIGHYCNRCRAYVKGKQFTWDACRCDYGGDYIEQSIWQLPGVVLTDEEKAELLGTNTTPKNKWIVPSHEHE